MKAPSACESHDPEYACDHHDASDLPSRGIIEPDDHNQPHRGGCACQRWCLETLLMDPQKMWVILHKGIVPCDRGNDGGRSSRSSRALLLRLYRRTRSVARCCLL